MYMNVDFLSASILNIVVLILNVTVVTCSITDIIYFVSHRCENLSNNLFIHLFMFLSVDGGSHHNDEGQVGIKALALGPLQVAA